MSRLKLGSLAVCFGCLLGSAVWATQKPVTYTCEITAYGSPAEKSWIPKKAIFVINRQQENAKMALSFQGDVTESPSPVSSASGFGRDIITLKWSFKNAGTTGTFKMSVDYGVRLNTRKNTMNVRAWPRGFDNDMTGSGKCVVG